MAIVTGATPPRFVRTPSIHGGDDRGGRAPIAGVALGAPQSQDTAARRGRFGDPPEPESTIYACSRLAAGLRDARRQPAP